MLSSFGFAHLSRKGAARSLEVHAQVLDSIEQNSYANAMRARLGKLVALVLLTTLVADGQTLTTLHNFSSTINGTNWDGAYPNGGLLSSGNTLYGTASGGGIEGYGTVFAVNSDGSGFTNLYDFTNGIDGANPYSGVILSGHTLFGVAEYGGTDGNGTVFALATNGTSFRILHSFSAGDYEGPSGPYTNNDGAYPAAALTLSGSVLYGTARAGAYGYGTVFAVNTDGTSFTNLYNFTNGLDGAFPSADLIFSQGMLYGTASDGGAGFGTVFTLSTNGGTFTILFDFTNGADGANPYGGLVLSGNTLYGMATLGGNSGDGTLFALSTNGAGFTSLFNFVDGDDGSVPYASLALSGNTLYGAAAYGGNSGNGVLFAINTNGTGFTALHQFTAYYNNVFNENSDGAYPVGALTPAGATLLGAAPYGGAFGNGTVFSLSGNHIADTNDQISGYVVDVGGDPIPGVAVVAVDMTMHYYSNSTDYTGYYSIAVTEGEWQVGVDCGGLAGQSYQCVSNQNVYVAGNNNLIVDFTAVLTSQLQVSSSILASAVAGQPYVTQLLAIGDNPPINWSLSPGSEELPSGLILATNGILSGIPIVSGTFYLSVRATDSSLNFADQTVTLVILPPAIASLVPGTIRMLNNNIFQFEVSGPSGYYYTVETSTNLSAWSLLSVSAAFTNVFAFTDESISNVPARFYRVALGPQILDITNQAISAAEGGTITLASGGYATIPAGLLSTDVSATLSVLADPGFPSQNGLITSRGPAMLLTLTPVDGPLNIQPNVGEEFRVNLSKNTLVGAVPFLGLNAPEDSQTGGCGFLSVALDPSPNGNFVLPVALLQALGLNGALYSKSGPFTAYFYMADIAANICNGSSPKPLLWQNGQWTTDFSMLNPTNSTLLFIHGMMSSVETAFPDPTSIMQLGGYCQAIGFDYDWTQGINVNGLALASFLNSLRQHNQLNSVDIEAHSEGVAVALSGARYTAFPISNMTLLGGPVTGTPAANSGARLATLLEYLPVPGGLCVYGHHLADIEHGQFVSDLQANSPTMAAILQSFEGNPNRRQTKIIQVAGENPQLVPSEPACIGVTIFGSAINDGIVPESSALGGEFANATRQSFQLLSHTQLETDPNVITFVASILTPWSGSVFTVSTNQLYFDCENQPSLHISNSSPGCLSVSYSLSTDVPWLSLAPATDTMQAGQIDEISISPNSANLTPGTYTGTLMISNPAVPTNSQTVAIIFDVPGTGVSINASSLSFSDTTTSTVPVQTLTITNTAFCGSISYSVSNTVPWLTTMNSQGSLDPGDSATITVGVSDDALFAGASYQGSIVITETSNLTNYVIVPVSLSISNAQLLLVTNNYANPGIGTADAECQGYTGSTNYVIDGYNSFFSPSGSRAVTASPTWETQYAAPGGGFVLAHYAASADVAYQYDGAEFSGTGSGGATVTTSLATLACPCEVGLSMGWANVDFEFQVTHTTRCQVVASATGDGSVFLTLGEWASPSEVFFQGQAASGVFALWPNPQLFILDGGGGGSVIQSTGSDQGAFSVFLELVPGPGPYDPSPGFPY